MQKKNQSGVSCTDESKSVTEKAEAYCDQPRCAEMSRSDKAWHRTKAAWLDGHAEGRREALEMAQGLVDALTELKRLKAEYLGNGGLFNPELMHLSGKELARVLDIAPKSLAKFEAWREGK